MRSHDGSRLSTSDATLIWRPTFGERVALFLLALALALVSLAHFRSNGSTHLLQLGEDRRWDVNASLNCPASAPGSGGGFACGGASSLAAKKHVSQSAADDNLVAAHLVHHFGQNASALSCSFLRDPAWKLEAWPPPLPAVFTNMTVSWPAQQNWSRDNFLRKFRSLRLPLGTFLRDHWMNFVGLQGELRRLPLDVSFEEFLHAVLATGRNMFLFERDSRFPETDAKQKRGEHVRKRRLLFDTLGADYTLPPILNHTNLQIFAMDGLAAGHGMHRHGEAWLAAISGRKVWWVAPPLPSKESSKGDRQSSEFRRSFPYKLLSSEEGGWPCSWLLREDLVPPGSSVQRCVQQPGEVVVLPEGWWHMTCSLDEFNVAIGGQKA